MTTLEGAPPRQNDEIEQLREAIHNLRIALEHRDVIGCAKGILMVRYGLTQDEAFLMMVRLSQSSGTKVYLVAQNVVQMLAIPVEHNIPLADGSGNPMVSRGSCAPRGPGGVRRSRS